MNHQLRILVVDDDEHIVEFVSWALSDEGYQVLTAANGAVALDMVRECSPDLILLDMRTPVMDGWQFARSYRELPGPHAPIVVFSATRDAAQSAAEIAASGFLAKPFQLDELLETAGRYTRQPAAADDPA